MEKVLKDKKGFTLVEVIAVLVILAILMAIAIPNVNAYIRNAKDKQVALEARNIYLAAAVVAAEKLETSDTVSITAAEIQEYADVDAADITVSTTDSAASAVGKYVVVCTTTGEITVHYMDSKGTDLTYPN